MAKRKRGAGQSALFEERALAVCAASVLAGIALRPDAAWTATPAAPQAAQPAPGEEPRETLETFGDWVVRCEHIQLSASPTRVCEVAASLTIRGQQQPIAQIAIGRPPGAGKAQPDMRLTILLPVNVSLEEQPRLELATNDPNPIRTPWRECIPRGCFGSTPLAPEALTRLKTQTGLIRLWFKNAAGREISLPLSPRGLSEAFDDLAKKPNQKSD